MGSNPTPTATPNGEINKKGGKMLKILLEKWDKNKGLLEEKLRTKPMDYQYRDLVKLTFDTIYNSGESEYSKIRSSRHFLYT